MKPSFLKYLCCPDCKADFDIVVYEQRAEEIIQGGLICKKCQATFKIIDSIPVVLNAKMLKDFSKTKTNWEKWWDKIRIKSDIELYDSLWIQAEKNLGGEPLYKEKDFEGKIVLDAGCGNGRHIQEFSKYVCKEIIAVDLGRQVFKAKDNNQEFNNVHYLQADITNLPLKDNCVDVIASHGVLHHTPRPKDTFSSLAKHLKAGGMFALYVYHKEWQHFKTHKKSLFLDFFYDGGVLIWQTIRKMTSRLPHFLLVPFCYCMAIKSTISEKVKLFKLIPPFAYEGVNFHERLVRNYDHYSATFNYFQTTDEVVDWFETNNLNDLEICSIPVSIRGVKQSCLEVPLRIKQYPMIEHFKFREEWDRLFAKCP